MNREQFFKWNANAGSKILTCYIGGKLVHPNFRDWMKIPLNTKVELPCGTLYTIMD